MMFCWINITRSLFSCISSKCTSLIIILKSLTSPLSNGFLKLFGLCCLTCRLQCLKKLPLLFAQCDAPLCFQREANRVWREQFMSTSDAAAVYQDDRVLIRMRQKFYCRKWTNERAPRSNSNYEVHVQILLLQALSIFLYFLFTWKKHSLPVLPYLSLKRIKKYSHICSINTCWCPAGRMSPSSGTQLCVH